MTEPQEIRKTTAPGPAAGHDEVPASGAGRHAVHPRKADAPEPLAAPQLHGEDARTGLAPKAEQQGVHSASRGPANSGVPDGAREIPAATPAAASHARGQAAPPQQPAAPPPQASTAMEAESGRAGRMRRGWAIGGCVSLAVALLGVGAAHQYGFTPVGAHLWLPAAWRPAPEPSLPQADPAPRVADKEPERPVASLPTPSGAVTLPPAPAALSDPLLTVNDRPVAPPPTGVALAPLREALSAYRSGDVGKGDAAAARLRDPAARALLEWTAIRYAGATLDFARINRFLTHYPDWPSLQIVRRQAEYALMRQKAGPDAVIRFFGDRQPETPHGVLLLAGARQARGDAAAARELIVQMWRDDSLPAALENRVVEQFGAALSQTEHRNRMEHFLLREDWAAALRAATRAGPDYVKLARARMAVAQARTPGKAAETALNATPEALRKDLSWRLSRAMYLRKRDDNDGARAILLATPASELSVDGGDGWWIERRILARRYLDAGKPEIAYQLVNQHGAERDALKIEAEFHAGWIALRYLDRPKQALAHFEAAAGIAGTPVSLARTFYWRGRAQEALGDDNAARADYEAAARHGETFYGQAARIKLGDRSPLITAQPAPPAGALDRLAVRAVRLLHEADADDMAGPLYLGVARTEADAGVVDLLARLAANRDDARAMVNIGKAAMQRGLPLADAAWPVQGAPQFTPTRDDVERALVLAIARQESVFDPAAMSSAGARGLMQLMPATAQRTAAQAGKDFDLARLTTDAAYNATLGAHHVGELLDDWRGSYILSIAAYNAGGGNVRKWLQSHGDPRDAAVDPIDWIELIPFSETRNYVQRVLENLQVYRQRLQPGAPMQLAEDLRRGVSRRSAADTPPSHQQVGPNAAGRTASMPDQPASRTD